MVSLRTGGPCARLAAQLSWGWPCLSRVLAARLACQGGTLATGVAEAKQAGWPSNSDYLGLGRSEFWLPSCLQV